GDPKSAAAAFERARAAGSQNPELLNDLGVAYARLGRLDEARALLQELLAEDPDAAGTWRNLGLLELSAEQPDAAANAFRRAVTINPANGEAWRGLGVALIDRNRDLAIDAWRHAERLQPRDYD